MVRIRLNKNTYKGDGKAWLAKILDGKYQFLNNEYLETKGTGKGGYAWDLNFKIVEDGEYVAHECVTGTYSKRYFFRIENGRLIPGKAIFANGYHRGSPANFELEYEEVNNVSKID